MKTVTSMPQAGNLVPSAIAPCKNFGIVVVTVEYGAGLGPFDVDVSLDIGHHARVRNGNVFTFQVDVDSDAFDVVLTGARWTRRANYTGMVEAYKVTSVLAQVDLNRLVSIAVMEGAEEAKADVVQLVNLPRADLWLDVPGAKSLDRLGQRVRVKVRFQRALQADFDIRMVADGKNATYSGTELGKARYAPTPPEQLAFRTLQTGGDGTAIVTFDLPPAGDNRFYFEARDDGGVVEASKAVTTLRHLFYKTIAMERAVVAANFGKLAAEYLRYGVRLQALEAATMPNIEQVSDNNDDEMKANARQVYEEDADAVRFGARVIGVAQILKSWAYGEESKFLHGINVGPGQGTRDLVFVRDRSTNGRIWFEMGDGHDWFVGGLFTPDAQPVEDHVLDEAEELQSALYTDQDDLDDDDSVEELDRQARQLALDQRQADIKRMRGEVDPIPILKASCVTVRKSLDDPRRTKVTVDLEGITDQVTRGMVMITARVATHTRGGLSYPNCNLVCVATESLDEEIDADKHTAALIHEIGHKIGMVSSGADLDAGPNQYTMRGHNGSHCHFDLSDDAAPTKQDQIDYSAATEEHFRRVKCVMFGKSVGFTTFCASCGAAIRKQNLAIDYQPF